MPQGRNSGRRAAASMHWAIPWALLLAFAGCGQQAPRPASAAGVTLLQHNGPLADHSVSHLQAILLDELARRGRSVSGTGPHAPSGNSAVFDLAVVPVDPDGSGPAPPTGYQLSWTERVLGDYDGNAEVNLADLTPIAREFGKTSKYDDPALHGGIPWWPTGNPAEVGGAGPGAPIPPTSGAANWVLARVDGDNNGEVNVSDLTPLGIHLHERLDGYVVLRRRVGESAYTPLPNPAHPGEPCSILRADLPGGAAGGPDASRPVRYAFTDAALPDTTAAYEYRVAPYDAASGERGPLSITRKDENADVSATFTVSRSQGPAPLTVNFDASGSVAHTGQIIDYEWDFDNNGVPDFDSATSPLAQFTYPVSGSFLAVLRVATGHETAVFGRRIAVGTPPVAVLQLLPAAREVPLTLLCEGDGSTDADGTIVKYEWDEDGDGNFELDTGPVSFLQRTVTMPGTFTLGLRVTDSSGATATTSATAQLVDQYGELEDDDSPAQAMPLGTLTPGGSLAPVACSLGSSGYDGDTADWFAVDVPTAGVITVDTTGTATGDLRLRLWDKDGVTPLAAVLNQNTHKQLTCGLRNAGTYYISCERDLGAAPGPMDYALSASYSALVYDETEPDDGPPSVTALGTFTGSVFPGYWGNLGPGGLDGDDEDWWQLTFLTPVDCTVRLQFSHQDADLDLFVYSSTAALLGESVGITDNESVALTGANGTIYILCRRHAGGTANYQLGITTP